MERCEAIALGLVDGAGEREIGEDETHSTYVAPEGSVVQAVEVVVISCRDVSVSFYQEGDNVVTLLRDGIMQGCVSF